MMSAPFLLWNAAGLVEAGAGAADLKTSFGLRLRVSRAIFRGSGGG